MLKLTVVLLALVSVSFAGIGVGPVPPKPDKFKDQEGCYVRELDEVIPFGSSKSPKSECKIYICETSALRFNTCSSADVRPPCYLVEDNSKPFPQCCHNLVCPEQR